MGSKSKLWATATLAGVSTTFKIHIVESPIQSIEIEDVFIIENANGEYADDGAYIYSKPSVSGTVKFKDGTQESLSNSIEIKGQWYYVNIEMPNQNEEPLEVNQGYEATATFLGASDTFTIHIVENPIEKIIFKDQVLIRGFDTYNWDGQEYYAVASEISEIIMKKGETFEKYYSYGVVYKGQFYYWGDHVEIEQDLEPGNTYQYTDGFVGIEATYNVTIKENPIETIELVQEPKKTEYVPGEVFDLKGAILRVMYTDGSYEDIVIEEHCSEAVFNQQILFKKVQRKTGIEFGGELDFSQSGQFNVEIIIAGKSCVIPVWVEESSIESIAIRENDEQSIIITMYHTDGSSYDVALLDDLGVVSSFLYTDRGLFRGYMEKDGAGFYIEMYVGGRWIRSNVLENSAWYEVVKTLDNWDLYVETFAHIGNHYLNFNNKLTKDNIDQVIRAAFYLNVTRGLTESPYAGDFSKGDDVRNLLQQYFALNQIDLTLSQSYNANTDFYDFDSMFHGADGFASYRPSEIQYSDGVWKATSYLADQNGDYQTMLNLELNDDFKIVKFEIGCEEHTWDDGTVTKKGTCKAEGTKEYTCTTCGATKKESFKVAHKYKVSKTTKATTSKNGKITKKCSSCSKTTTETIYYAKSVSLSKTKYTYDGKSHKPTVTVKDSKGNEISSSNYTVSYASGCKNAGRYKVTIKLKGNYSGTLTKTFKIEKASQTISAQDFSKKMGDSSFSLKAKVTKGDGKLSYKSSDTKIVKVSSGGKITIVGVGKATITITAASTKNYDKETEKITITVKPKTTSIKSVTSSDEGELTVKWSKDSAVTHYQVQYSTSSDFDKAIKITASNISELTLEGLEEGETYYVQIRTYKKVDGTKYYSSWSSTKSVKVK